MQGLIALIEEKRLDVRVYTKGVTYAKAYIFAIRRRGSTKTASRWLGLPTSRCRA